jgi:hypothetical protein
MVAAREVLYAAGGAALARFADAAVADVAGGLGHPLAGAWVVGSVAAGDVRGAASDLDLLLAVDDPLPTAGALGAVGSALADLAERDCPLRGVEAVLYPAVWLAAPRAPAPYLLNVNAGPRMDRRVAYAGDPAFWFVLDVAAAPQQSVPLLGPPAHHVIGAVPRADVLAAVDAALAWHEGHAGPTPDTVLGACRSLHWLRTGRWVSKTAAGRWLMERHDAPVVRAALASRAAGQDARLRPPAVAEFVATVRDEVTRAARA